jgi:DNA repair protein SbcD/Mre11
VPGKEKRLPRVRFLHTADLHLSRPFGILPPQLAEERRRDQRRAIIRIADLAIDREVDVVLIAGDLFDSPDPDPTDLEAFVKECTRLSDAGKLIFAIPGNHDYASPGSFWHRLSIPGLHTFLDSEWDVRMLEDLGIAVAGIAFNRRNSGRRAFDGLEMPTDMPSIVLVHASFEAFEGQLQQYHPFSLGELMSADASYIALGHYHKFNPLTSSCCYPGTPEGIGFDLAETEDRFVVIGEIGDDGAAAFEPVKINRRTMRHADIDCTTFESQSSLFDAVRSLCERDALVELKLFGAPPADIAPALEELAARFKESCLHLAVDASDLAPPVDAAADDRTIKGRFCSHLLKQMEETADPERRRLYRRALELGLTALAEE